MNLLTILKLDKKILLCFQCYFLIYLYCFTHHLISLSIVLLFLCLMKSFFECFFPPPGKETNTCVAMQTSIPSGLWTNHGCTSTRLPLLCEIHRVGFTAPPTHTTVSNLAPCPTGWLSKGGTCYKVCFCFCLLPTP